MKYCVNNQCTILSSNQTEALSNVDHYELDSHVSIPTEESVEIAMSWVEENIK